MPHLQEPKTTPAQSPEGYIETVQVDRLAITTYVLDSMGVAVPQLTAADFVLHIDGSRVPIESVDWIQSAGQAPGGGRQQVGREGDPKSVDRTGRVLVILFQWEVGGQKQEGFLRMQRQALSFIDTLKPDDRVAVLGFTSRLWLRQDFTGDRDRLKTAVRNVLRPKEDRDSRRNQDLSLGRDLTAAQCRSATSLELALRAIAESLRSIGGPKSLLLFGWGIGTWRPTFRDLRTGYVRDTPDYEPAQRALSQSETSVISLDISNGEHGLAAGLEKLSFETGGFYLPTYLFPSLAMNKVERSLGGYYIIFARKPLGPFGRHAIAVRLSVPADKKITVLHRRFYHDEEAH